MWLLVIIFTAGVPRMRVTEEGFEEMFACNYFGPFLLTNLLLGEFIQHIHRQTMFFSLLQQISQTHPVFQWKR